MTLTAEEIEKFNNHYRIETKSHVIEYGTVTADDVSMYINDTNFEDLPYQTDTTEIPEEAVMQYAIMAKDDMRDPSNYPIYSKQSLCDEMHKLVKAL